MTKTTFFSALGALAASAILFSGCTSVESTQKFNRMGLGTVNEKAVCQTYVEIPGYYLFDAIPIFVGSPEGDGKWTMFRNNLTTENAVYLLTRECKTLKAARVINVQVNKTRNSIFFNFLTRHTIQASGTGVRTRSAALDRTAQEYDAQP